MGTPIDGKGEAVPAGYRPIENAAPGIKDRKSVSVPMETGILAIDSMFPIAGDSVSSSSATGRPVRPLSPPIPS